MRFARCFLVAATLALASACGGAQDTNRGNLPADVQIVDDDGLNGAQLSQPYDVPDIALTATTGAPFSLAVDANKPLTLVFFGYTKCPDTCQIVMSSLAASMLRLGPEVRSQVDVVLVTTDPARDDVPTLKRYLARLDPTFIGVTGALKDIRALAHPLHIFVEKGKKLPSGGYEVDHSTPVIGIDGTHRASIVWTEGTSAKQFADDINALLAQEIATR